MTPKAFLSYTWEDEAHREWVRALAEQLRSDGVETILDRWHAIPGDQLPQFMESSVREADFVLLVCTQSYKHKSDVRKGGVGYEGDIMTGEVFVSGNRRKFIPILRKGPWESAAPSWLLGTYYLDFSNDSHFQSSYCQLVARLLGKALPAPPVAVVRFSTNADGSVTDNKSGLTWGLPHDEREYPIGKVLAVLANRPHGYADWRLPSREEVAELKATMEGYFPPPVTLYSKVHISGAGTMEKGPWNKETLEEKTGGSGSFFNPSFLPDYALQAMAESSSRLIRPVRAAPVTSTLSTGKKRMRVSISLNELLAAYEWVSSGEAGALECEAYVDRNTGSIHWRGEGIDEELPEDIEDGSLYIAVPQKSEFDLGRALVIRFVEEHLPQHQEAVHGLFRKKGAYAHFKSLLARAGHIDAWHEYERVATVNALRQWCEENGFELVA